MGPRTVWTGQEEKDRALEAQRRAIVARRRFISGQAQFETTEVSAVYYRQIEDERIVQDLEALFNETRKGGEWRGQSKLKGFKK